MVRNSILVPVFSVWMALAAQGAQESWTKPIEALITSGDLAQARERLDQETAKRGETPAAVYLEARILFEQRRYADALKTLEPALRTGNAGAELYKLAALSAIRLDRLDIAEPALKRAAQLAPADYLVHFHLGALYYTQSLFQAAKSELEKAVELNASYMPARLFLGLTLEEVGDEKTVVENYRKAIELAAAGAAREVPYVYLGRYYYRLNRFAESLALLEKAVEINPRSGEAQLQRGKALHAMHHDAEAVSALMLAAAADVNNAEPHYLLFRIFESQNRVDEAQAELKRFQELNKEKPAADPARRKVAGAR
ncbi:MAG TPA: tetratricopeptide repeat protein [Bryobacteraceae bacterium]|nr:tetratricopeptide repeat protein [Bryobacteraceae bacterium]